MVKAAKKLPQLQAELGLFKQEGQRWSAASHDWASAGFGSGDCGDGLDEMDRQQLSVSGDSFNLLKLIQSRWREGKAAINIEESRL